MHELPHVALTCKECRASMASRLHTYTTTQVLEALAQEGLTVSDAQVGRWYREGLLIEHERRDRGRGRSVDWY
jgi:hypothetical protein